MNIKKVLIFVAVMLVPGGMVIGATVLCLKKMMDKNQEETYA